MSEQMSPWAEELEDDIKRHKEQGKLKPDLVRHMLDLELEDAEITQEEHARLVALLPEVIHA